MLQMEDSVKKPQSLRMKIFILMSILVALQSLALVSALVSSNVFFALDAEAFRLFESTIDARARQFNTKIGDLVVNASSEAMRFADAANSIAVVHDLSPEQIHMNEDLFEEVSDAAAETIFSLLNKNSITGAYFILSGAFGTQDPRTHLAVYIRNSAPGLAGGDNSQFLMEIGPISLSQKHQVALSSNWDLFMEFTTESEGDLYYKPQKAAKQYPGSELTRYGYWAAPSPLLRDSNQVITYSLPLLDRKGQPFGVLGVEISLSHFAKYYLPNTDIPYPASFYALTGSNDNSIDLNWYIPSGPLAQLYLEKGQTLPLKTVPNTSLWQTTLEGLGEMYCSMQPLRLYSENSPFYDSGWTLTGFVSKEVLHNTSYRVRTMLIGSIVLTALVALIAIFILTYFSTRKIAGLSQHVRQMNPHEEIRFKPTGLQEIDDLTSAVEKLHKSVINSVKVTEKIMELTNMPMGCYQVEFDNPYVTITGHVYDLLGLPHGTLVSQKQWAQYYEQIMTHPSEDYANTVHYHHPDTGRQYWLRVREASTDIGRIGTIMDVTDDIETQRSLAKELDYDSLTRLYTRTAFKREVHAVMQNEPNAIGAMLFIDLDNLKYVNDTYGHDAGDQYLVQAGEIFGQFRRYGGIASRISGDEFTVYLHGYKSKEELERLIHKQLEESSNTMIRLPNGKEQQMRYSGGIAWYPADSDNVTELLRCADFAMYEAKHQRKGTVACFDRDSYRKNIYLLENRETINKVIDEGLIRFAFQPVVEVATGEIFGYEALMRPTHESFASPFEVLKMAAAEFKLYQLERMVMFKIMKYVYQNRKEFGRKKVFVNSIPNQQLSPHDFAYIQREYGVIFPNIIIEFIENENVVTDMVQRKADTLRNHGISIAIDDFGTGYSNELQVLSLNPDIIKIDMRIIRDIDTNVSKQQFVKHILSFSRARGIKVVAEGVETEGELLLLRQLGLDFVQGYLLGRPDFALQKLNPTIVQLLQEGIVKS